MRPRMELQNLQLNAAVVVGTVRSVGVSVELEVRFNGTAPTAKVYRLGYVYLSDDLNGLYGGQLAVEEVRSGDAFEGGGRGSEGNTHQGGNSRVCESARERDTERQLLAISAACACTYTDLETHTHTHAHTHSLSHASIHRSSTACDTSAAATCCRSRA